MDETALIEKLGERNWWHSFKTKKVLELVEGNDILDLACGPGSIGEKLLAKGKRVTFLDNSKESLKLLRKKHADDDNARVVDGDASRLKFSEEFDCCICADALEHMEDDVKVLNGVNRALRKGGCIIINSPAVKSAFNEHDRALGHLRRYDRQELVSKLGQAGFRVEFIKPWNFISLAAKYFSKFIGKRETDLFWKMTDSPLNGVLKSWLEIEWLLPLSTGSSIIIKARKVRSA